jgi:isoleucyl-tRNA synthetase
VQNSLIRYKTYICAEILADSLAFMTVLNDGIEVDVNNAILKVNVLKKG